MQIFLVTPLFLVPMWYLQKFYMHYFWPGKKSNQNNDLCFDHFISFFFSLLGPRFNHCDYGTHGQMELAGKRESWVDISPIN